MKLLAIDTSSQSASCAISEDGLLLGEFFTNVNLTHSQTILPMVQNLLAQTRLSIGEIDRFGVTVGPGSFTGLRIGISAVKGMAHALAKPCVALSTLEALAWNFAGENALVAPVLDARCAQVYTALFRLAGGAPERLTADEALPLEDLGDRLKKLDSRIILVGDGAHLCYNTLISGVPGLALAPAARLYTSAASVALACERLFDGGQAVDAAALVPAYLRLPQAERELRARQDAAKNREDERL